MKHPDLLAAATTAVIAAEKAIPLTESGLSLGPAEAAIDAARDAIEALRADGVKAVITRLEPTSVATLADLAMAALSIPAYESAVPPLLDLHEAAVDGHLELAEALRGPRGLRIVDRHAVARSGGQPGAAEAAVTAYVDGIAQQLAQRPTHPLHAVATILVRDVPALKARVGALAERHRQQAEAEAERVRQAAERAAQAQHDKDQEAERKERAKRLSREDSLMRGRRDELAAFYKRHGARYRFVVAGIEQDGDAAAAAVLEGAEFKPYYDAQQFGQLVRRPGQLAAAV